MTVRSLAVLALTLSGGARTAAAQGPSFPAGVEVITVDAVVFDSHDRPVSGLTRDDFSVFEDGKGREIVSFEAFTDETAEPAPVAKVPSPVASNQGKPPRGGRAFVLILDDLRIASQLSGATQKAVQSFLEHSVRDGDEVILGTASGDAWWSSRIPEGRDDLLAVLKRFKGRHLETKPLDRMTEYEAFWINTHEDTVGMSRLLPDAPAGVTNGDPDIGNPTGGGSVKDRVKARWKDANLCTGTSCDGMVRARAADLDADRKGRTNATLQAIRRGLEAVAPIHGRKSVLLFSEGLIDDPSSEQRNVTNVAREANAAIYFVNVRGLTALSDVSGAESADQFTTVRDRTTSAFEDALFEGGGSESLAENTGGFSIRNTNDLAMGAERIAAESRVFYLLGVNPLPGKSPRDWRKLRVEVNKPGLKVRARRGYSLAASADAAKPKKKDDKKDDKKPALAPAMVGAIDSPHDATDIPLRAVTYVLEPMPKSMTRVLVAAEFDAGGSRKEGPLGPKVDLSIVATQRDTGTEFRFDQVLALGAPQTEGSTWRAVAREIEMPAGVAQVRVVVRDPASGAMGSISQRIEVPAGPGLRVSTPIVTDRVEPAAGGGKRPRPAVSAHRVFAPAGGLYIQFEVFGAASAATGGARQVTAGLTIRNAKGEAVRTAAPSPIAPDADGRLVRTVGIGIDGLSEGAYVLALDVHDEVSGGQLAREEAFTLAR